MSIHLPPGPEFDAGSDARLAGLPITANPYAFSGHRSNGSAFDQWKRGWESVHFEFGADANWPVRRLPTVQETRS